jgi:hypothetical protein
VKNYRFNWALGSVLVVVIIVLTLGLVLYAESSQTLACLSTGCGPTFTPGERIAFDSVHVNSPTNITATLSNAGSVSVALVEYFVKDSYGNMYSNTTWAGPTISPGATASANILLAGGLTGQPFQIQSGHTYTVTVVTARNNPFPYAFTP